MRRLLNNKALTAEDAEDAEEGKFSLWFFLGVLRVLCGEIHF